MPASALPTGVSVWGMKMQKSSIELTWMVWQTEFWFWVDALHWLTPTYYKHIRKITHKIKRKR